MNDLEFWNSKLSALAIALRNGKGLESPRVEGIRSTAACERRVVFPLRRSDGNR